MASIGKLGLLAYLTVLEVFSLWPGPSANQQENSFFRFELSVPLSNALHVAAYAGLAFLVSLLSIGRFKSARNRAMAAASIALAIGIANEGLQWFVPGRGAYIGDVAFDALGVAIGIWFSEARIVKQRLLPLCNRGSEEPEKREDSVVP